MPQTRGRSPRSDSHESVSLGKKLADLDVVIDGSPGTAPSPKGLLTPETSGYVPANVSTLPAGAGHSPRLQSGEGVFGDDDRALISDTTAEPWRQLCCLEIQFPRRLLIGSGALIGPRAVATAGHCVFDPVWGGKAVEITVTPGRNGPLNSGPYGSAASQFFKATKGWIELDSRDSTRRLSSPFDYAVIVLPTDLGTQPGWMAYGSFSEGTLLHQRLNTAGYPVDKPLGTLWWNANSVLDLSESGRIHYRLDTRGGQSGSAVWTYDPTTEKRVMVGIHTAFLGDDFYNSAVRITPEVRENFQKWVGETS